MRRGVRPALLSPSGGVLCNACFQVGAGAVVRVAVSLPLQLPPSGVRSLGLLALRGYLQGVDWWHNP